MCIILSLEWPLHNYIKTNPYLFTCLYHSRVAERILNPSKMKSHIFPPLPIYFRNKSFGKNEPSKLKKTFEMLTVEIEFNNRELKEN
ncbi:hypothetical protein BpHYR1_012847 [Brachionus plicatilis]|uniref:Uncharacterized protein n=1 Tax=Brachionus plicatilis TaxID=10195 RepID=A0A3M7S514_BRAPC|nr:hypothetical protein BpHYR1_012847 [Brachionus plicatilis]